MIVIHLRPRTRQPLRVAVDAVAFPVASWHGLLAHVIRKMDRVPEANSKLLYALDVTVHDSPATADWTHPEISHFPPVHKCNMLYERGIWYAISLMGIKNDFNKTCKMNSLHKWIHDQRRTQPGTPNSFKDFKQLFGDYIYIHYMYVFITSIF